MPEVVEFQDFDQEENFAHFQTKIKSFDSQNFVLDFSASEARCAFDISRDGVDALLKDQSDRPPKSTRWINIWRPESQQDIIIRLGKEYGFSPRLLLSMCSSPGKRILPALRTPSQQQRDRHRNFEDYFRRSARNRRSKQDLVSKTPSTSSRRNLDNATPGSVPSLPDLPDVNHYRIVDQVWHFASVDWGRRFSCIGFNSIYQVAGQTEMPDKLLESNKPAGKRVWAWLVMCDDNTVISIHENPFPNGRGFNQKILLSIRHNMINVFKQLTRTTDTANPANPIMTVHIRPANRDIGQDERRISSRDSPSLLYYYLFDDWYTTYNLVARSEHQYGAHLENTREAMFHVADLKNINQLHHIGRQLKVLKRIYQSYIMLIERILKGPQAISNAPDGEDGLESSFLGNSQVDTMSPTPTEAGLQYGVRVTTSAAVRFERLRDRISLYALSEIQDCLDEKESLVMLNFNLIALRESSYVERLTRITIFLAKVTILFIPVSLMSTYFAVPIPGIADSYTLSTYWITFAVVFALSLVAIVIFGRLSGTQEGKPVYRSLTQVSIHAWKRFFSRTRPEEDEEDEDEEIKVAGKPILG